MKSPLGGLTPPSVKSTVGGVIVVASTHQYTNVPWRPFAKQRMIAQLASILDMQECCTIE